MNNNKQYLCESCKQFLGFAIDEGKKKSRCRYFPFLTKPRKKQCDSYNKTEGVNE